MLRVLLAKDLRRAWRNPVPYLIFLTVPLVMTALLGFAFGGGAEKSLGRPRLAVVDEDGSLLGELLRGSASRAEMSNRLDCVFLARDEALRQVTNNQLSAALIIPKGFTRDYLLGSESVRLELVKNPAQSFSPAIVEEFSGALVAGLNALSRNLHAELDSWRGALDQVNPMPALAAEVARIGEKLESVRALLFPPLVSYQTETRAHSDGQPAGMKRGLGANLFALLLPGFAAMFLLFLADVAMRDLYREVRLRTFERFCTLPQSIFTFVCSKVIFTVVLLMICSGILFGGGALLFRIHWARPWPLALTVLAFSLFAAGFMAVLASLAGVERRAEVINNVVVMLLALASGCAFPMEALPEFLRNHVTPWLPPNVLLETVRKLHFDAQAPPWKSAVLLLAALGLALVGFAAWRYQRRLGKGLRA